MVKRKIIEIDEDKCTGGGACVTKCAGGALAIVDGKAKVVNEVFCDGLGACIGECPEDALKIIEREAPEFDEEAVKMHISGDEREHEEMREGHAAWGCPGHDPIQLKMHGRVAGGRVEPKSEELP